MIQLDPNLRPIQIADKTYGLRVRIEEDGFGTVRIFNVKDNSLLVCGFRMTSSEPWQFLLEGFEASDFDLRTASKKILHTYLHIPEC